MSGGSYNYAYRRIEDLADEIVDDGACDAASAELRRAFKAHLRDVAEACRAIEWNDSCDGYKEEEALIRKCLCEGAEIVPLIERVQRLQDVVKRFADVVALLSPGGAP
jgi:hypothetical protein